VPLADRYADFVSLLRVDGQRLPKVLERSPVMTLIFVQLPELDAEDAPLTRVVEFL
jgi:hypothetical protein